ncbi:MAG: endonuclease/exonuclease/phosphatase family protein [Kiritimatiellae bacterium]|nr:endonuclease/exonuclease/phosphatase family protein [Kiritimatiellia bacterium]
MISRVSLYMRWFRKRISRIRLASHLIGKRVHKEHSNRPGLIMIQVDGLSRKQIETALKKGRLPFLSRLIREQHFSMENFYSGIPSTTPAVQAEIFYGRRTAVPAFHFLQRETGRALKMLEPEAARDIDAMLKETEKDSLIKGGRSYSNIYQADAETSRYCAVDFAQDEILRNLHPLKGLVLAIAYFPRVLRIIALSILEFALALFDVCLGLFKRHTLMKELQFVPARIGICIVLRELIRFRILLDIENGVRLVHANFLGYDEQAHRRGPDSAFAHWTLRGIDKTLRDIYRAAHRSDIRDYELILYSDHGQEHSEYFEARNGRTLQEALGAVFAEGPLQGHEIWQRQSPVPEQIGNTLNRCEALLGFKSKKHQNPPSVPDLNTQIVVTAQGPIGHLYLPRKLDVDVMRDFAKKLVTEGGIPLVVLANRENGPRAFNAGGEWDLLNDKENVFGAEHPFLQEVAEDTVRLCQHPDVGDFVISGWDPTLPPLSFPRENGAHGGPGSQETNGFLLLPDRIRQWHLAHLPATRTRVRGEELREIALHYLGGEGLRVERVPERSGPASESGNLRIMSYNIHSCRGMDGKVRPERIARVINAFDPDVVAVQEVDAHRPSSGSQDQAHLIAEHLRMKHVFLTMLDQEEEGYGIAIFSKHPFEKIQSGFLTPAHRKREGRGAICLRISPEGRRPFTLINTHFGLRKRERLEQVEMLLSEKWLAGLPENEPVVLCGDFNSFPGSEVYALLQECLHDVWTRCGEVRPRAGFPSIMPLLRLDHIFVGPQFTVNQVGVPRTTTTRVASDHLPLCTELNLPETADAG